MTARYMDILFTPEVKREQDKHGSGTSYARLAGRGGSEPDKLGPKEIMFIAARDSFYIASLSASGWPYLQHRGGPAGFVRIINDGLIGFADYRGNRQYISLGNVATDQRISLFFMDYVRRVRLKLLGRMRPVDLAAEPDVSAALVDPTYGAAVERGFVIAVEAFDWNCPQHITPRWTRDEVALVTAPLEERIAALTAEIAELKAKLS